MTEENSVQETAGDAEQKSSTAFWVVIIIAVVLVVMIAMGGGLLLILAKAKAVRKQVPAPAPAASVQTAPKAAIRPAYTLDTFIVPLAAPQSDRFLRITLALELAHDSDRLLLQQRLPEIRDAILEILPKRSVEQVTSAQGKESLRREILEGLLAVLPGKIVLNLYFTELTVE